MFVYGDKDSLLGKDDLNLNGLNLKHDIASKILCDNFLKLVGSPKKVNKEELLKELEREKDRIKFLARINNVRPDISILKEIEHDLLHNETTILTTL